MADDFIQFAFSAGELSPQLSGRSDVEIYDLGLQEAKNWIVDFRGGISTRPGLEFCDHIQPNSDYVRLCRFRLNNDTANDYLLIFIEGEIRFMQDGAYVLEAAKTITGFTTATNGVITVTSHGYSNDDLIKLTSVGGFPYLDTNTFRVSDATTNTFKLRNFKGALVNTAALGTWTSGGNVQRVFTLAHSYALADLPQLKFEQYLTELVITHPTYKPAKLIYTSALSWTLSNISFGTDLNEVTGLTAIESGAGTAGVIFGVAAVNREGEESFISDPYLLDNIVDYTTTSGFVRLSWTRQNTAEYYKIYRSIIFPDGQYATLSEDLGLIGISYGNRFIDRNQIADFTLTPVFSYSPLDGGRILSAYPSAVGAGYDRNTTTLVFTDGGSGSGARGYPIISNIGTFIGLVMTNRGKNYSSPVCTVTGGGGAGATVTITAAALTGYNPGCSARFQQRRLFAGSINEPTTVFGSKPGHYENFNVTRYTLSSDSYSHTLDAEDVTPIRHLVALAQGLLCFTESSVWLLRGADDAVLSAISAKADMLTEGGANHTPPLVLGKDVLFVEANGANVNSIDTQESFNVVNISARASHLIKSTDPIISWAFARTPSQILWAVTELGRCHCMTYVKAENIKAWTPMETQGSFENVAVIVENGVDVPYFVVRRWLQDNYVSVIERAFSRNVADVEDMLSVDSGVVSSKNYPATSITVSALSGTITVTASASTFVIGDVGRHIRFAGRIGRGTITAYTSATVVTVVLEFPIQDIDYHTDIDDSVGVRRNFLTGNWSMDTKYTTWHGFDHLEGESVEVLADGEIHANVTVTTGAITLSAAASYVVAGKGYYARLRTLPISSQQIVIGGKLKRIIGLAVRVYASRKYWHGTAVGKMFAQKETLNTALGSTYPLRTGVYFNPTSARWGKDDSLYLEKRGPVHVTVLGLIPRAETEDGD